MGIKINALGVSIALIFSNLYMPLHWPLFIVGAILSAIGIFMLFQNQ